MNKTPLIALVGAATLAALLTGCSAEAKTGHTADRKPSASSSASSTAAALPSNECVDGQLTVTDVKASKTALAKGCATISLLADGAHVTIGATKMLSIEGSHNTVTGTSIGAVHAMGTGNGISYTGDAPDTEHLGEGNTAEAAK